MRFVIKHEIRGRIRVHVLQKRMTYEQADTLYYYLNRKQNVTSVKVYERSQDVTVSYVGNREEIIRLLKQFSYETTEVPDAFLQNSGRQLNDMYWEKLVNKVVLRGANKLFLPYTLRAGITIIKSIRYIWQGIQTLMKGKIEVPVLDATAIGVSIFRSDFNTAGSVMFLLGIGELLEEWTHKKSVGDLARSMSLNIDKVWVDCDGQEVWIPSSEVQHIGAPASPLVKKGDRVIVHMGNMIPFDGVVEHGEAMVNQASMTGESAPVHKKTDSYVYAGTVVEEGGITLRVEAVGGSSRFEKIVQMIEESEKLKSSLESKASHLADRLVPYTLAGTGLVWLFTRNVTKALSILMVDFSCALKLAMPISVLSAIREASLYQITVKGGKYLEAVAEADTIVFDKTGTLTKTQPTVKQIVSFNGFEEDELLRIAACMEEHFPHSIAKAVVDAAQERHLVHDEMHSQVEYIVAHGISTTINEKKAIIGSYHFVFEDENCIIPEGKKELFNNLPPECTHLYLAIEGVLAAVICIEDPLREEAEAVISSLKKVGIKKVVMMTGDSERTAKVIAQKVGVDEYYSEVLPEDKARYVEKEKDMGRKVIMVGDGVNDSPALSAADVGIAISDGAEIAREIADITMGADNLYEIVTLKAISNALMKRIHKNYRFIVGFNTGLIALGVGGILQPATSALLHNTSTLLIGLESMKNLIE